MLSTGVRCYKFLRPKAFPHDWWTQLEKPTRILVQTCFLMIVKPNSSTARLQEDTLSPSLFIIVLGYVLREAIDGREKKLRLTFKLRQSHRVKAEKHTYLNFAADITLFDDQFQQVKDLPRNVEESITHSWSSTQC